MVAPRSIAVIGASSNPTKSGGVLFDNLAKGGFKGTLYPINRGGGEIMGHKAYPTLAEVPERVDLVYIVLPQAHVEAAIKQCVDAKAGAACIITAGFSEASSKGRADEDRLREIAGQSGLLMAGPNTIGMVNADCGMMGSFVNFPHWEKGGVSFFTQTGIFTGAVMLEVMSAATQRLPVSKSIDVGNKIDVDELDFLNFAAGRSRNQGHRPLRREHQESTRLSGEGPRGSPHQADRHAQARPDPGGRACLIVAYRLAGDRRRAARWGVAPIRDCAGGGRELIFSMRCARSHCCRGLPVTASVLRRPAARLA